MSSQTEYDRVRYPGQPIAGTHPARLSAIARVHGIHAASPRKCRMLEVGCGDAAELLPLALAYPESQFLGIDLAADAIQEGEALRQHLGLPNLTLQVRDLQSLQYSDGPFDFIVARGVFSWVPLEVRMALLQMCGTMLAPTGVALITYNALPGWHIVRMIREMLLAHLGDSGNADERIKLARELLIFLSKGSRLRGPLGDLYQTELHALLGFSDGFLYHDELAEINDPYYLSAFMELAMQAGLSYLADADYFGAETRGLPQSIQEILEQFDQQDAIIGEQYRDFLNLRRYRQTLLVRSQNVVQLVPSAAAIPSLHVRGNANLRVEGDVDCLSDAPMRFVHDKGASLRLQLPPAKAAMWELCNRSDFPISYQELRAASSSRLQQDASALSADSEAIIANTLLDAFRIGLAILEVDPTQYVLNVSEKPLASPLVRAQLLRGDTHVTSQRRTSVAVPDEFHRALMAVLDGAHDHASLLPIANAFADESNNPLARVEAALQFAAREALLIA